jgi:hypothetical protein
MSKSERSMDFESSRPRSSAKRCLVASHCQKSRTEVDHLDWQERRPPRSDAEEFHVTRANNEQLCIPLI